MAQHGRDEWLSQSAGIRANPRQQVGAGNKKGQPRTVDLMLLVETAGIEPASASPLQAVLHT